MNPERWQQVKNLLDRAIGVDTAERSSFLDRECTTDSELRSEVESLLSSHQQAGSGFLREPALISFGTSVAAAAPARNQRIGAYQLVEEIGQGGMGEVYRAVRADGQYEKSVAIKFVRGGVASRFIVERFRTERQILASLDHPNIARLLDGGTTDDGIPYLVMELIDGLAIDRYCDDHALSVSERLQLFRQICEAVQYAHQRMVIHRDIKPGNILVTNEGVPKLLDFGIAKLLDPAALDGTTMARPMTPEFASPEQIRGELVTTATDVYSLAVVLYRLLTGFSPYSGDTSTPHGLAKGICDEDPVVPSFAVHNFERSQAKDEFAANAPLIQSSREDSAARLRRRLHGDIDNILMRALHKEPSLRYASVEQFSDDLRRHLEGRAVIARHESWIYRAGKFTKRHKLGMAATALVLVSLAVGAAATLREARIAGMNGQRAQQRFNDVRTLANSLIFELHDSIQDLPGATPARKLLVQRGLEYLDSLARESGNDASLQRELADAYERIGTVQGGPFGANLGDTDGAVKSYRKALTIREGLLAAGKQDINDSIRFAETSRLLGNALTVDGDVSGGLEHSGHAVAALEVFLLSHSDNPKLLMELTRDYSAEADILASSLSISNLHDVSGALPLRERQLQTAEQLNRLEPDRPETQQLLASSISLMGDQLLLSGKRKEALSEYLRAEPIFEALAAGSTSTKALLDLHDTYYRLGPAQVANHQIDDALTSTHRALEIATKLSSADPQNTQAQLLTAADYINSADVTSKKGLRREADDSLAKGFKIDAELARRHPGSKEFRHMRAPHLLLAGDIASRLGRNSDALRYYAEDHDLLIEFNKEDANNGNRLLMALALNGLGKVNERLHLLTSAADNYRRALEILASDLASETPNEDDLYARATAYAGLGEVEGELAADSSGGSSQRMRHLRAASEWFDLSLKTWSGVKEPGLVGPSGYDCIPLPVALEQRKKIIAQLEHEPSRH